MSHRLTPRSWNLTGEMCPMLKSTLSMVVISRWTPQRMKLPHWSEPLSLLHVEVMYVRQENSNRNITSASFGNSRRFRWGHAAQPSPTLRARGWDCINDSQYGSEC